MSTFRLTLRIIWVRRLYLLIYVVGLSFVMVGLSWSLLRAGDPGANGGTPEFAQVRYTFAVIDRDGGPVAQGLTDYLAESGEQVQVDDDVIALQDAVATDATDLLVIVPPGYSDGFARSAAENAAAPALDTVASYTSGAGALAGAQADAYLGSLRSILVAQSNADAAGASSGTDQEELTDASAAVLAASRAPGTRPDVEVVATSSTSVSAPAAFGFMLKTAVYPLLAAMTILVALVIGVTGAPEVRRRLAASPQSTLVAGLATIAGCAAMGLACWAYYVGLSAALTRLTGAGLADIGWAPAGRAALSCLAFTASAVALGFLVGQVAPSDSAANGVGNVVGLVVSFTSGVMFPPALMPDAMITLGKLMPGWWFATSVDHALGIGVAAESGGDPASWALGIALLLAFAAAFASVGLAIGRLRRQRPTAGASPVTVLDQV